MVFRLVAGQEHDPASASLHFAEPLSGYSHAEERNSHRKHRSKPRWNSSLKTGAEACLYFHFKATQTLFCFSYSATRRKHLRQTPREDSSASCLPCNARGGRKSYPLKLHLSCYRHRPSPQSFKSQPMRGLHASCAGTVEPSAGISKETQPTMALATAENTRV